MAARKTPDEPLGLWKWIAVGVACWGCYTYGRLVESQKLLGPASQLKAAVACLVDHLSMRDEDILACLPEDEENISP